MGYDIIGDIHGEAGKLEALLRVLGYVERDGAWRHCGRQAIFVGDFIDRGPRQLDSVAIVRRMVDAGSARAVLGNHEFNAIAWHTPDPEHAGEYLRPHGGPLGLRNRSQHAAFLDEVEHRPALHRELVDWFLTLPLWLELDGLRVVHACWHAGYMDELRPSLGAGLTLTPQLLLQSSRAGQMAFRTVEGLTKGIEAALPAGHSFEDKDGHARHSVRIRWWDDHAVTYRELAMLPPPERERLPALPVAGRSRVRYDNAKPVFFGHYWMSGAPAPLSPHAACVDYSAGRGGPLVAYRWDGEPELDARHFVSAMA